MAFGGWPVEAVEFYEGLEADNSRAYWLAHKPVYDRVVRAPMDELLAELAPEFGEGRVFRPNRDVRFSHDKSPYKLNCAAQMPGGYVSFSADELFVGSGLYMPSPEQLRAFRSAVADDRSGAALEAIVDALRAAGYAVGAREVLKTAPRGFPKDHPRIELLRHKGLIMSKAWPVGAWLGTRRARDRVVACLDAARPLNDWLGRHAAPGA